MIVNSSGIHTLLHFFDAANFVFLQKNQGLGHLFQIVAFRPPCIAFAFALGELCLNVNQQVERLLFRRVECTLLPLPGRLDFNDRQLVLQTN